jgi:hypothetical protein
MPRANALPPAVRPLLALTLFAGAFGYVEAAVVVYVRASYEPLHQRLYPGRAPGDLLPFIPLERLIVPGAEFVDWPTTELFREAATLAMLAGAALAAARNGREWFAAFVLVFGVWDISYYISLKSLIDWPASLLTWDVLFLVPVVWAAPVLAPLLTALAMTGAGAAALWREAAGRQLRLAWGHWLALVAGGAVQVAAFCGDHRNLSTGGAPNPFPWPLFALGLGLALAAFAHAWTRPAAVPISEEGATSPAAEPGGDHADADRNADAHRGRGQQAEAH